MLETQQYCTFFLDEMLFGIEARSVQEILRYQEVTPVALAPKVVAGLINLRGQIVTAIDLRIRFEFDAHTFSERPTNVIVTTEDGPVSLLVDEISDVVEVGEDTFESVPDTLAGVDRELITGVHKLKERLLLILDLDRAINPELTAVGEPTSINQPIS